MDFTTASRERQEYYTKEVCIVVYNEFADGTTHDVASSCYRPKCKCCDGFSSAVRTESYKLHNKDLYSIIKDPNTSFSISYHIPSTRAVPSTLVLQEGNV